MYTVTDASGAVLFTGIASGAYTDLGTGYRLRLVDQNQNVLYTGGAFTIDNKFPTLTGIQFTSSDETSGYIGLGDEVTLSFTASEELSGLTVLI